MRYFFDSSAIFKRYYRERGTDWVRALCEPRSRPILYLSQVAQVEVTRALRQKQRAGDVHHSFVDAQINQFERHLMRSRPPRTAREYDIVPLTQAIVEYASALCDRFWDVQPHPLRSLDALQLASALITATSTTDEVIFVTADRRLEAVAPVAGLRVVNPEHP